MSKFKVGEPVRVIMAGRWFDATGVIEEVQDWTFPPKYPFRVRIDGESVIGFTEHELTLADPDAHTGRRQMAAEPAPKPVTVSIGDHAVNKSRKDMAEMEIDGEYERGGSVDHAATLKAMAQGLAAEMDAEQNAHREAVTHPSHYTSHPSGVECLTITRHMGFNTGNAFKYIWRADLKGNAIQDLEKAAFYIADEIAKRRAAQ